MMSQNFNGMLLSILWYQGPAVREELGLHSLAYASKLASSDVGFLFCV